MVCPCFLREANGGFLVPKSIQMAICSVLPASSNSHPFSVPRNKPTIHLALSNLQVLWIYIWMCPKIGELRNPSFLHWGGHQLQLERTHIQTWWFEVGTPWVAWRSRVLRTHHVLPGLDLLLQRSQVSNLTIHLSKTYKFLKTTGTFLQFPTSWPSTLNVPCVLMIIGFETLVPEDYSAISEYLTSQKITLASS